MKDEIFLDTNVLVYLYSTAEPDKQTLAQALVNHHQAVISTQVLSELANVLRNKFKLDYQDIAAVITEVTHACRVVMVTSDLIVKATQLAARYKYSFYDSLILAVALTTPCTTLYSEDFQHGQVIDSILTIQNPFMMRIQDIPKPTIITPPKTFTKPTSLEGVRKNNEWMKQHYQEYQGQWIALHEGELLGANKDGLELFKAIEAAGQMPIALFVSLA